MSQFLILIYDDEAAWMNADEATSNRLMAGHNAFAENNGKAVVGGNALQSVTTATTVRPDGSGGFAVTDGPFVETKEALGGYYLVEAADLDEAIALAKQVPLAGNVGGLEVRPIMVFS
ncbi:MAG: YciI family protein [Jatrophihabitantaceae bacterium]